MTIPATGRMRPTHREEGLPTATQSEQTCESEWDLSRTRPSELALTPHDGRVYETNRRDGGGLPPQMRSHYYLVLPDQEPACSILMAPPTIKRAITRPRLSGPRTRGRRRMVLRPQVSQDDVDAPMTRSNLDPTVSNSRARNRYPTRQTVLFGVPTQYS